MVLLLQSAVNHPIAPTGLHVLRPPLCPFQRLAQVAQLLGGATQGLASRGLVKFLDPPATMGFRFWGNSTPPPPQYQNPQGTFLFYNAQAI